MGSLENARQAFSPTTGSYYSGGRGELQRRSLLQRARCIHKASTTQRDTNTAPMPAFLQARATEGQALPQVEVVAGQKERQPAREGRKREASSEAGPQAGSTPDEEERFAVLGYVMKQPNQELFTELLQGFHEESDEMEVVEGDAFNADEEWLVDENIDEGGY